MSLDDAVLKRFINGDMTEAELENVASLLQNDAAASSRLDSLRMEDPLLRTLRGVDTPAASDAPDVQQMIERLSALHSRELSPTSSPGLKGKESTQHGAAAEPFEMEEGDILEVLGTAQGENEMGRLGGYRIIRMLGKGGMGAVFEAEDVALVRKVALKVMLPGVAAKGAARKRFLREARTAATVEHDNVIPIFQVGEDRGVPFLAMPLLRGTPLDEKLNKLKSPMPASAIVAIGKQVAAGLAAAHAKDLIHRDIKPSNIWLETDDSGKVKRAKILDFGLARAMNAEDDGLTRPGSVLGTPAYMAPEQARGLPVDARADLFSLGCVLYHMSTGRRPFRGADAYAVLTALAIDTPTPPIDINPALPDALSRLIEQLLAKDPEARPQTAKEVVELLGKIASSKTRDSKAHPVATVPAAIPAPESPTGLDFADLGDNSIVHPPIEAAQGRKGRTRATSQAEGELPRSRSRMFIALGLVGFAAVIAVAGVIITVKNKDGTETRTEVAAGGKSTVTTGDGTTITVENTGKSKAKKAIPPAPVPTPVKVDPPAPEKIDTITPPKVDPPQPRKVDPPPPVQRPPVEGSIRAGFQPSAPERTPALLAKRDLSVAPGNLVKKGGTLGKNEVWSGRIYLDRDVLIPAGNSLIIDSGTAIAIQTSEDQANLGVWAHKVEIIVEGELVVAGTTERPVSFFTVEDEKSAGDAIKLRRPPQANSEQWGGIAFARASRGELTDVHISNAKHAIYANASAPKIRGAVIFESEVGLLCGNRSGDTGKGGIGGSASPEISDSFIFRCKDAMTFINNCGPTIRNCVMAECDAGLHYLGTSKGTHPTIEGNVLVKVKQVIENRASFATITGNVLTDYDKGLVITASDRTFTGELNDSLICDGNVFGGDADRGIMAYYMSRVGRPTQPVRPGWFKNNRFEPVAFVRPDFKFPPDGDWSLAAVSGAASSGVDTAPTPAGGLKLTGVTVKGSPFQPGDGVALEYQLNNASGAVINVPTDRDFSIGYQHWVERLGDTPTIPSYSARAARSGRRYAAGGAMIPVPATIPKDYSKTYKRSFDTTDFPPGKYRYYVELKNANKVIQTESVDVEILPKP